MPCPYCGSSAPSVSGRCSVCGRASPDPTALGVLTSQPTDEPFSGSNDETRLGQDPIGTAASAHTEPGGGGGPGSSTGPLALGQTFGTRYHIIRLLGMGGMGAVYQAWDTVLELAVAIKVIRPEATLDPEASRDLERRFKRELLLARQVTHKNVVRIHDLGEIEGIKYISMPYVQGEDLATALTRQGRLPVARALSIARQVAAGLAAAHEVGVVHRDLKPANIMIDEEGHALIMDFGIARSVSGTAGGTVAGAVVGTLEYMAPEQAQAQRVDHRADIYAFGLIFYDMLLGARRHSTAESAVAELLGRMRQAPSPIRSIDPTISEAIAQVIGRCLEPDPTARYQTTAELVADLDRAAQGVGTSGSIAVPAARARRWPAPAVPRWLPAKSTGVLAAIGVGAIIAAVLMATPSTRGALLRWASGRTTTSAIPPPSEQKLVAVLPFQVLGDETSLGHIAVGLSEALSAKLFQLKDVKVASRASVEAVNTSHSTEQIGRELGVNLIVAGTVRGGPDRIRITARLEDTVNGERVWVKDFDAVPGDLLTLEDQMFSSLLAALELSPTGEERALGATRPTQNIEAYDLYLRGRNSMRGQYDPQNVQKAIDFYGEALKKDSRFALAYAGLADANLRMYQENRDQIWADRAVSAAEQAQVLDPKKLEVLLALGNVYVETGRTTESVVVLNRALKETPNSDDAHRRLGRALLVSGRRDEGIAMYQKAIQVNPYYWGNHNALGTAYLRVGEYDRAIVAFQKVIELEPESVDGWNNLGAAYLQTGQYREAIPVFQKAITLQPTSETYTNLGIAYTSLGMHKEAVQPYEKAVEMSPSSRPSMGNLADGYRWAGDIAKANATYDKAIALAYQELAVNPRSPATKANLALYYAKKGDADQALRLIKDARSIDPGDYELTYNEATVHLFANRRQEALARLREAFRAGYPASFAATDPDLKPLWDDPGFKQMVAEFRAKSG